MSHFPFLQLPSERVVFRSEEDGGVGGGSVGGLWKNTEKGEVADVGHEWQKFNMEKGKRRWRRSGQSVRSGREVQM